MNATSQRFACLIVVTWLCGSAVGCSKNPASPPSEPAPAPSSPEATAPKPAEPEAPPPSDKSVIAIDGSSTVFPITEAVAEEFQKQNAAKVTIGVSGTGGGFKKFCAGEI